ncbi:MAG: RluA family pseudouridine synthase [Actinomycetota bacterium]|nr:RluA family pseudouridine synthase [Actinomycetota bacterium]
MISYRATDSDEGARADVVLAREAAVTRTRAQRALRAGEITVDGDPVRPSHRMEAGQRLVGELVADDLERPRAEDIPIEIRYRDERVLVVSKPAGLVTHPARGHETGTLVNALLGTGETLAGAGSVRPGIVHRLDKDTSGLLIVAKDDAAQESLVHAMSRRMIVRRYLALVRGVPPPSGSIDAPIGRHPARRTRMAVVADGRPSVTNYRVRASHDRRSLLDVDLETGRTHQIRVHLSHIGHPILGDRTYGGMSDDARALGLARPFLHAFSLEFPHPDDGRVVAVEDPLPADLAAVLEVAGLDGR